MVCLILTSTNRFLASLKWAVISIHTTALCYLQLKFRLFSVIGLLCVNCLVDATEDNPLLPFNTLYTNGINSYLENDWARCISYLELSLNDWHWWNKNIARCRESCYKEANSADIIFPHSEEYEFDRVFEKLVLNTLCLVKCKKEVFGSRIDDAPPSSIISDFEKKKPYDYLQLCYYKHGLIKKAADAAATLLASQPNHDTMQLNLKYYIKEGGLSVDTITNLEMGEYAQEFLEGDKLYLDGDYAETIIHLEKSLKLFWESLQECRLGCEDPFDMGWFPDFVSSVANHYTFTLRCKIKCSLQLSSLYTEGEEDLVSLALNYLQYSYYKVDNIRKACEAVESMLVLIPDNADQIRNKEFFRNVGGVTEEYFTPRKRVVDYKKRKDFESRLLKFIEERFTVIEEKPEDEGTFDKPKETETLPSISETLLEIAELFADDVEGRRPLDKDLVKEKENRKEEL